MSDILETSIKRLEKLYNMKVNAVFVFGTWISRGYVFPGGGAFQEAFENKEVKEIHVDISDPRNFSSVPAHVYITFDGGDKMEIVSHDIAVIEEDSQ